MYIKQKAKLYFVYYGFCPMYVVLIADVPKCVFDTLQRVQCKLWIEKLLTEINFILTGSGSNVNVFSFVMKYYCVCGQSVPVISLKVNHLIL